METYTQLKDFVDNPHFDIQRKRYLNDLERAEIDYLIQDLIRRLNALPHCFTLQCCYGHFVYEGQADLHNLEPLPESAKIATVDYRIAYIALCLDNNDDGHNLYHNLIDLAANDPEYLQFGCAEWFWKQQVNSFVLQVEPVRYAGRDRVNLDFDEAKRVEKVRDLLFKSLTKMI